MTKIHIVVDGENGLQEPTLVTLDEQKALQCYHGLIQENGDQQDEGEDEVCIEVEGKWYYPFDQYGEPVARIFSLELELQWEILLKEIAEKEETLEQFALRDVLTDLRHVAEKMGLDFDTAVEGSEAVYHEEKADED